MKKKLYCKEFKGSGSWFSTMEREGKKKGYETKRKKKKKHFHLGGSVRRETTRFGIY